jgi:hypothetical protein
VGNREPAWHRSTKFGQGDVNENTLRKGVLRAAVLLALAFWCGNILAQAQTLTTIHSFTGTNGDGEYPFPNGRLPFDNNGALYGTTASGGTASSGTVFQLVPPTVEGGAWTENVLYSFAGGADGRQPGMNVVFDRIGNLYGTTQFGGNAQAFRFDAIGCEVSAEQGQALEACDLEWRAGITQT